MVKGFFINDYNIVTGKIKFQKQGFSYAEIKEERVMSILPAKLEVLLKKDLTLDSLIPNSEKYLTSSDPLVRELFKNKFKLSILFPF